MKNLIAIAIRSDRKTNVTNRPCRILEKLPQSSVTSALLYYTGRISKACALPFQKKLPQPKNRVAHLYYTGRISKTFALSFNKGILPIFQDVFFLCKSMSFLWKRTACSPEIMKISLKRTACSPEIMQISLKRTACFPEIMQISSKRTACFPEIMQFSSKRTTCFGAFFKQIWILMIIPKDRKSTTSELQSLRHLVCR